MEYHSDPLPARTQIASLVAPSDKGLYGSYALVLKMTAVTLLEALRWAGATLRDFSLGHPVPSPRRRLIRLVISGWLRELFTLGVTADVYAGVPALYVNFVDYDVTAHELGPDHPAAFHALRAIDASIHDIARVVRRERERVRPLREFQSLETTGGGA